MAVETERKFLIVRPSWDILRSLPGVTEKKIVQTYLSYAGNTERRIRKITENGAVTYVYTEKRPIPGIRMSRMEDERGITEEEYRALMKECMTELDKTRIAFPYEGHIIEIDIYPHEIGGDALEGYAVMEVELSSPDEAFAIPGFIEVKEELTGTKKFSNKAMAKPKRITE
ncbi:MAG: hypothetical protein IKI93_10645 [Clostridia bacterium]|nr:hypothetical protein [Clostridia bacterium]